MSSYALQIQAAAIAAYNAVPTNGLPAASDVHWTPDLELAAPTTAIVMGSERVLPEERDVPLRRRRLQLDVVHRVRATDVSSAAAVVDPMRIRTIARLVGSTLGGLALDVQEVGTTAKYSEDSPNAMFIQALDVIYVTRRNDLTQR